MTTYPIYTASSKNEPADAIPELMTSDMHDITSPEPFLSVDAPWWQSFWFWALLAAAGIIISLVIRRLKNQDHDAKQRRKLLEDATDTLKALKGELSSLSPQESVVRISLIMREFLKAAFEDPALFETAEEFTLRPEALALLNEHCRTPVVDHLNQLSELKYQSTAQPDSVPSLIDETIALLHTIEPAPAEATHSPDE